MHQIQKEKILIQNGLQKLLKLQKHITLRHINLMQLLLIHVVMMIVMDVAQKIVVQLVILLISNITQH